MHRFLLFPIMLMASTMLLSSCAQGPAQSARMPFPHQQPYAGSFFPQNDIAQRSSDGQVEIYDVYGSYQPPFVPIDQNARQIDFGVMSPVPHVPQQQQIDTVSPPALPATASNSSVERLPPPKRYNN